MRPPLPGVVVRGPDAHEHRAHVLVAEIELDLLVRALDDERREGLRRPAAGRSSASPPATEIMSCSRIPTLTTRPRGVAPPRSETARRSRPARSRHAGRRRARRATTSWNRSRIDVVIAPSSGCRDHHVRPVARSSAEAVSIASWSRPSTRSPCSSPRARSASPIPPGQPWVDEWLSTTTTVRRPSAEPPRQLNRLAVAALVELCVSDEADHARARPASHVERERQPDGEPAARARASRSRSRRPVRARGPGGGRAASRTPPKPARRLDRR